MRAAPEAIGGPGTVADQPARRRRLSSDQRRAQILRGCVQVLAEHGYEAASLARIAARAGVSKGLVSHYFADRDTLMYEVAVDGLTRLRTQIADRIDLTAPVPTVLHDAIHQAARLSRTNPDDLRAAAQVIANLRRPDGSPRLDVTAYEETYLAQEGLLRRGQAEGTLRAFDTRVMAVTYQGAIDTMISYLTAHPDVDPDSYADQLSDVIIAAVAAPPPGGTGPRSSTIRAGGARATSTRRVPR